MSDPEHESRVQYITEQYKLLNELRRQFAKKHGFYCKRPQNFKNCVIIKWNWVKRNGEVNYPKLDEYVELSHELSEKYKLWDEKALFMDSELRLLKAGIYSFTSWNYRCWAIPNENKEIQEYVLSKVPKWAKLSKK